jgi:hypothetical protein
VIRLSRTARAQLSSLAAYYEDLERPEAVRNLRAAVTRASERIDTRRGLFFSAPRPYRTLTNPGWIWLKEGWHWIAYTEDPRGAVIQWFFMRRLTLRGQFRGISETKMLNCVTRLGNDVKIVVGPARRRTGAGRIEVLSA